MTLIADTFAESELTGYTEGLPLILTPENNLAFDKFIEFAATHRDSLRRKIAAHGAVLFRDCPTRSLEDFHILMKALQITPSKPGAYFGEVTRPATGQHTMVATQVPPDFVLGPHNEGDYWYTQPEFIAFFCESSDCAFGQTPLAHGAKVAAELPAGLRDKLMNTLLVTEYVFDSASANKRWASEQQKRIRGKLC